MSQSGLREVEHDITISAPAAEVYRLIADVGRWPQIFPPTIHVDYLRKGEREERIQIWATANGAPKNWTSRRVLDADRRRIDFRQEVPAPPVASMGGAWLVEPLTPSESRVRLLHDYRATDDDPRHLAWIDEAVERNSRSELDSLKNTIERARATADLAFSFVDTVQIRGSAQHAFDFINDAHLWPDRLPHVSTVRLSEDTPGLQCLEMDTRTKDGSTHTTRSYRVTFAPHRIAYKQVTMPALMALHTGCWTFEENGHGVAASSQHTVVLNAENIARILGERTDVAEAKEYVRNALSTNSRTTLEHAKDYAENAR